jgi:ABC-2 type transport system ATP-binding protein
VVVKEKIRKFIRQLRDEKNTTVILTTHDMDDIDQICDRIVIIDKGRKLVDESLDGFKQRYNEEYYMEVAFGDQVPPEVTNQFTLISEVRNSATYRFVRSEITVREAMRYFANNFDIADITMRNASLEEIVRNLY